MWGLGWFAFTIAAVVAEAIWWYAREQARDDAACFGMIESAGTMFTAEMVSMTLTSYMEWYNFFAAMWSRMDVDEKNWLLEYNGQEPNAEALLAFFN